MKSVNCPSQETEETSTPYKTGWKCHVNDERPTGKKTTCEWDGVGKIELLIENKLIICVLRSYNGKIGNNKKIFLPYLNPVIVTQTTFHNNVLYEDEMK